MVSTFDIVSSYIENANMADGAKHTINEESMDILADYCGVLDTIFDECMGSSVTVDLLDGGLVSIEMTVAAFSANRFNQSYFDLIERAVFFTVTNTARNELDIKFVFPSVFDD